ncbi:MAG: hypothetical protein WA990_17050 [Rubrobacteraceae bacterium]
MSRTNIFRTEKIPSLSRLPKELGREDRFCDHCGTQGEHILYRVPKKLVLVYIKDHQKNLHATCLSCAHSTVVTGPERERLLSSLNNS